MRFLEPLSMEDASQFVRCTLETVSLKDQPVYTALSYEWARGVDESHNLARCVIDEAEVFPTQNLRLALHELRLIIGFTIPIWIDAICINQQDLRERE